MKQLKKLSLMLVALLSMTAGAWAQESNEITVTPVTGKTNEWTFKMPDADVELTPIYAPEFTATFKAGNANTIQSGAATVKLDGSDATPDTDGKFTPVYEGQTITLTAVAGYKFRKVEVKKVPALKTINIEDVVLVYEDGDTWEKIKDRNPDKVAWDYEGFIKVTEKYIRLLGAEHDVKKDDVIVSNGTYNFSLM